MAQGAIEIAAIHYPLLVVLHASWLMALWVFGHDQPVNVIALLAYLVLQGLRVWVMATSATELLVVFDVTYAGKLTHDVVTFKRPVKLEPLPPLKL